MNLKQLLCAHEYEQFSQGMLAERETDQDGDTSEFVYVKTINECHKCGKLNVSKRLQSVRRMI